MSLRKCLVMSLPLLFVALVAPPASAHETRVALFGGYASEIRRAEKPGDTSYGWGLGTRVEHAFDFGLYLSGAFVGHLGTSERAEDRAGNSTYRVDRHAAYLGPEVGWEFGTRLLFVRPYVGAGAWYVFGRTVVRNHEVSDNALSPYVLPGLFFGYRSRTWNAGLDFRLPIATELPVSEAAPTMFLVVAVPLSPHRE